MGREALVTLIDSSRLVRNDRGPGGASTADVWHTAFDSHEISHEISHGALALVRTGDSMQNVLSRQIRMRLYLCDLPSDKVGDADTGTSLCHNT